jgi:predicted phosphodiesterase
MRVFGISDIHVDHAQNAAWLSNLSREDYQDDILILAGDISDSLQLVERSLTNLADRFSRVMYVPGNHELWVIRDSKKITSFEKFHEVCALAQECGASTEPLHSPELSIIPLFGWYDYSFGDPSVELEERWGDYFACNWPPNLGVREVTSRFVMMNEPLPAPGNGVVITFSHFLPRIDLMPSGLPEAHRYLYPVLGSAQLERQLRHAGATLHLYGHSHINRRTTFDGITYINNAFGYPTEKYFTAKCLLCIHGDDGRTDIDSM